MSNIICFYHGVDLDGHASGAIVKRKFPQVELVPIAHENKFPFELVEGKSLIMVDFSLSLEDMIEANERAAFFTWIDHHKTAIDALEHLNFPGIRRVDMAACELVWQWYFPEQMMPWAIHLLGRWDVWDHEEADVRPFQYGMRSYKTDPRDPESEDLWDALFEDSTFWIHEIIDDGAAILRYVEREFADYAARFVYETDLAGVPALAINRGRGGSDLFKSVYDQKLTPLMISYAQLPGGAWLVSLYSDHPHIHAGKIAEVYGGGGHKGAAGFVWKGPLPFVDKSHFALKPELADASN